MMYLLLSEMNYSALPADPTERAKITAPFLEIVKKDLDRGELMMWGMSPGGQRGFALTKQDPKELFGRASTFIPYVKFKVLPMLSLDEVIDVMKSMQP